MRGGCHEGSRGREGRHDVVLGKRKVRELSGDGEEMAKEGVEGLSRDKPVVHVSGPCGFQGQPEITVYHHPLIPARPPGVSGYLKTLPTDPLSTKPSARLGTLLIRPLVPNHEMHTPGLGRLPLLKIQARNLLPSASIHLPLTGTKYTYRNHDIRRRRRDGHNKRKQRGESKS